MAPHLVRAQSAEKDIRIYSFHHTHTHTHTQEVFRTSVDEVWEWRDGTDEGLTGQCTVSVGRITSAAKSQA